MEGGLRWDTVEEVGEGVWGDDGCVAEVLEFLEQSLVSHGTLGVGDGLHTALMVRMERLTIAVCISSIGAMSECDCDFVLEIIVRGM